MSSKDNDPLSQFASNILRHPQSSRRIANGFNGGNSLARFVRDRDETQTEYLMRQTRVTVGRSSARGGADVDMGESSFISRYHIEIYIDQARFFILVTGKNGVFVDDVFVKKGSPPMELPATCELRFPSTAIRLKFESLVGTSDVVASDEIDERVYCETIDDSIVELPLEESTELHSSVSVVATDEDTNSDVNAYVDEVTSDGDQCTASVDAVPISLETEEVWAPSTQKAIQQRVVPVSSVRHTNVAASNSSIVASNTPSRGPRDESKPPYSYAQLIVQAIMSTVDKQLTLSGIYAYITQNYPYYRASDKGWQNSIRHNLSLNRYFIKVARSQEESGKGSFWRVDPSSEGMLVDQAFRRRRQRGSAATPQFMKATIQSDFSRTNSELCTPEDSLSWEDQAVEEDQQQTVYIANHMPEAQSRVTVQRVGDFNWNPARLIQVDANSSASLVENTAEEEEYSVEPTYEVETAGPESVTCAPVRSLPQITLFHTGLPNNSSASMNSPAAVVRYITTYSQGNAVKQAVLFPVMKVASSESAVVKTTPSISLVNNGSSLITNGLSLQQQLPTALTARHFLQQNTIQSVGPTEIRFPTVLAARKRPADGVTAEDGVPRMKTECIGSAAV